MPDTTTIAILFQGPPGQWGLRGDPHLWQAMQAYFAQTALPSDADQLVQLLAQAFETLTEQPITVEKHFFIERFDHGGMSSGLVSPQFWREKAVPLLCSRYIKLTTADD